MNIRREQTDAAPHECTECKEPAYIPFSGAARCTNWHCSRFDQQIWEEHVMSLPDEGDPPDIEDDEPTQPGLGSLWVKGDYDLKVTTIDDLISLAERKMDNAETGMGLRDAIEEYEQLLGIKKEYDRTLAEINEAIDTMPVPCYNVGNND